MQIHADPEFDAGAQSDYDVIVIRASAGGLIACTHVLRGLPHDCAVPVAITPHLPSGATTGTFFERLGFNVEWARPGSTLEPGRLLICPPHSFGPRAIGVILSGMGGDAVLGGLARETDWALSGLGPMLSWPEELRLMVHTAMDSRCAMAIW